jgi:hypothetical protein
LFCFGLVFCFYPAKTCCPGSIAYLSEPSTLLSEDCQTQIKELKMHRACCILHSMWTAILLKLFIWKDEFIQEFLNQSQLKPFTGNQSQNGLRVISDVKLSM